MPWTPQEFRSRHNHKLSDSQANEASRVANALLRKYGDEGKAIRIANSVVQKAEGGQVEDELSLLHQLQDAARMKANPPEPDHPALRYLDPGFCAGGSTDFKGIVDGYAGGGFVEKLVAALRSKVSENEVDPALARLRSAYADAHQNWMSAAPTGDIDTQPLSNYLKIAAGHVGDGDTANALANARAALDRSQVASRSAANPLMIDKARRKFVNQALGQLYDAHDYMNLAHSSIDPASHVPFPYPSREGADPLMTDLERAKP